MKRTISILLLGTLALFLTGCYHIPDGEFEPQAITPVLIAQGENCYAENLAAQNRVIKTSEDWHELLNTLSEVSNSFTETEIDFSRYMVLAVFDEVKGNGGWSIDITGVTEFATKIVVNYTNLKTGNVTHVITQPYHIVKIPKSDKEVMFVKTGNGEELGYPIEIPFEEYSLEGTSCQWKELSKDSCNYSRLEIIDNNEELEKYIDCTNGIYPEIDFSKHTLLLANGVRCYQDCHIYIGFQRISKYDYVMKIDFQSSAAAALKEWQVAIVVDKLDVERVVTLKGGNVELKK
ncbi:MAG: protease complex subunit PrcB family protein [Cytophagaceae bacterium]|jgi:hypothetical protein|nr:protease complex subunit PrcB family protein [Cytophagaceae bacterium]